MGRSLLKKIGDVLDRHPRFRDYLEGMGQAFVWFPPSPRLTFEEQYGEGWVKDENHIRDSWRAIGDDLRKAMARVGGEARHSTPPKSRGK